MHQRQIAHADAGKFIADAEYSKALIVLRNALKIHGAHIGLLSDIAVCHYMLSQIQELNEVVDLLISEFELCRHLLTPASAARTLLMIGKLQEERAHLDSALSYYTECSKVLQAEPEVIIKARAQRLRLNSLLKIPDNFDDYIFCSSISKNGTSTQTEVEHALVLTEALLFGPEVAFHRWFHTKNERHHKTDENLFFYDLLELVIEQGLEKSFLDSEMIELIPKPHDLYEQFLFSWFTGLNNAYNFANYYESSKKLLPFSHFRLLALAIKNKRTADSISHGHLRIILKSLPEKSQNYLMSRWVGVVEIPAKIDFSPLTATLSYMGQIVQLSDGRLEIKLIKLLNKQNEICTDFVIAELYPGESFSEDSFNKLRALLVRLEKKIQSLIGHHKCFKLSKDKLSILINLG